MTPGKCHVCGQAVYYCPTTYGRTITIDTTTSTKGTIIFQGQYAVEADPNDFWDQEAARYTSHAKTCSRRRRKQ